MRISDWSSDVCSSDLLAPALHQVGARHLCLNLDDADVATAASLRQKAFDVQPAAIAQVWVDSAITFLRRDIDAAIARYAARHAAYLVTESAAIVNREHPPQVGTRTFGFAQIAILRRPSRLSYGEWLDIWHNAHTKVGRSEEHTSELQSLM